ncbi:MAG: SDR family NAD(P)-dependent oxidoreductase [Clostridiales bacterium]|nr:SDR family NAD(P)-dependent oxidoreductase [Clostridiales bacterium]
MNQTVLITGASHGIGRAIATAFAKAGNQLIITCHHSKAALLAFQKELEDTFHIDVLASIGDIGDYAYVERLFDEVSARFGGVDILINNAAISHIGLLSDMSIGEWNRILHTNLTSVFSTSRLFSPYMVQQKRGKIINISSVWGEVGASCEVAYSACKGGVNAFTKALAKELAPSNVQVNAVACGIIDTRMNSCFSEEERQLLAEEIPAGRFGTPDEVASFVLSLAVGNDYLTGQVIALDGGWT